MFMIEKTTDFEFHSSTSEGAIQSYGYTFHTGSGKYGPHILRPQQATNFSVHDISLVNSPAFHFTMDTCTNGEVYDMIIRGGNEGGLDGVDVWGTNIHIHDVEVTNRDECVTVKAEPSRSYAYREYLLQLVGRLCYWLFGSKHRFSQTFHLSSRWAHSLRYLQHSVQQGLYLAIRSDVHDQIEGWKWFSS